MRDRVALRSSKVASGALVIYRLTSNDAIPTEGMYAGKMCGYALVMCERWRTP